MRLTNIALQKTFYGLVLGAYCFGLLTKPGSRPKLVAARMLRNPYRMYGFMTGAAFYGISNFPKYTREQVKKALIELVEAGEVPVSTVLKLEAGYDVSDKETLTTVDRYLSGKLKPTKKATLYVPYVGTGMLPTPPQHTSESTLKSIANMARERAQAREDRFESRRLAAIQYQQGLIESLEAELDMRRAELARMLENGSKSTQLELSLDHQQSPFLAEGTIPEVTTSAPMPDFALGTMPETIAE